MTESEMIKQLAEVQLALTNHLDELKKTVEAQAEEIAALRELIDENHNIADRWSSRASEEAESARNAASRAQRSADEAMYKAENAEYKADEAKRAAENAARSSSGRYW